MSNAAVSPRAAFTAGFGAIAPLTFGVIPFGLAYGAAAAQTDIDSWLGAAASIIILAGAAQLSIVDLIDQNAHWVIAIGTALVINARFLLYSAAVAPAFGEFRGPWRYLMPHMLTDQVASVSLLWFEDHHDARARRWFFLGAGITITAGWITGSLIGIAAGTGIPDSWDIGFAVPLMFGALLVPSIRSRPMLVAAVVAGAVTAAGGGLPNGTNVLAGALAGMVAGAVIDR